MTEASLPFVSVVMPVRNEGTFLERSLGSVLGQDYPAQQMEVLVADGMSADGTRNMIRLFASRDARVRLVDNPGGIVATGLNAALSVAKGEIVVRVDGHCEIAPDYISRCVAHLLSGHAEGVGGSVETVGQTPAARAIALAMSSRFGVGGSLFRTVRGRTLLVDTVAFPAYRRDLLERAGPFDEELVRNQDDEYNYRLRKMGARILLASDVRSRYYSRGSLRSLARQYFEYGYWKVRVMQKHPRQMRPRQFAPPFFVAALSVSLSAAPFSAAARVLFLLFAAAYAAANLGASLALARKGGWRLLHYLPPAFAALHFSYGAGFLTGLARFWNRFGESAAVAARLPSREIPSP